MTARAKVFEFAVVLDRDWNAASDRGGALLSSADELAWTPEHLVLTGLARCSLTSLRYHCTRAGIELTSSATARATVTRREPDGRFAFAEVSVEAEIALDPKPAPDDLTALLAKAERDCFVGASLTTQPRYDWTIG